MFEELEARLNHNIAFYAGYPTNINLDYTDLSWALNYHINNIGDPFDNNDPMSCHKYELEVITWFLQLFGANAQDNWGYVTSGGTEGIIFGMWKARDILPNAVVYMSDQAHYSVPKAANILNISSIVIKTDPLGQMDYQDLDNKLDPGKPAIIVATLGTTMTSAKDNVKKIRAATAAKNITCYIHADAAFDGMILPFVETESVYCLDQEIDSISISGHKLIGSPIPSGVVLIKKQYLNRNHINYISTFDCTLSGSRAGLASLILWSSIKKNGVKGYKTFVTQCLKKAELYCKKFNENNIAAWRFSDALTIILEKQPKIFSEKWRAPTNDKYTTLTALPKLTDEMVEEIIEDIISIKNTGHLSNEKRLSFPTTMNEIKL